MRKKDAMSVWVLREATDCQYFADGVRTACVAATVSILHICLGMKYAVVAWPYYFAVAAAVITALLAVAGAGAGRIMRRIPAALYACYYLGLSTASILRIGEVGNVAVPTLFLNATKLVSGIALILLTLLHSRDDFTKGPRYWDLVKGTALVGLWTDMMLFLTALITLNAEVFLRENPFEILMRMTGEFWLAVAVIILMHPGYVTISFWKINRLVRDYVSALLLMSLVALVFSLIVFGEVRVHLVEYMASLASAMIASGKVLRRKEKLENKLESQSTKNYIKQFCGRRWAYSYHDIADIINIQSRLQAIEQERFWVKRMAGSPGTASRLNRLDKEYFALHRRLYWRYSVQTALDYAVGFFEGRTYEEIPLRHESDTRCRKSKDDMKIAGNIKNMEFSSLVTPTCPPELEKHRPDE